VWNAPLNFRRYSVATSVHSLGHGANVITLTCDNCEKTFEVDDDAAGGKASCPYCGDIKLVPGAAKTAVPGVPAQSKSSGTVERPGSDNAERPIAVVRQAMFRAHPFWFSLMVLIFIGGAVLAVMAGTTQEFADKRWLKWVGVAALGGAALWWLVWWAAPHRWVKLIITNKRTIRQEGIVVRKTSEVLHNHIRNVKIEQSVMQRIFGVGSISIDSAGGSDDQLIEIHMDNVPRPYRVKELFDKFRRL
jgi:membrane protein YdbS with pleckstrin-like domain